MHIPDDVICKACQGVFCCAECRHKHEIRNHAILIREPIAVADSNFANKDTVNDNLKLDTQYETKYLFCPICENRPLPLLAELPTEMFLHIKSCHLPLFCKKCLKIYTKIDDLKQFTKCIQPTVVCQNPESLASNQSCNTDEASKVTVTKAVMPHVMTAVQSSPMRRQDFNENHVTPISIINMRWKAKSKLTHEEFISDSVSSIKNLSSISNSSLRRSLSAASAVKGKVIRCSSTPVHLEMVFSKPKEQTFNATGTGHISSIQCISGSESDISPAYVQPSSQAMEPINRYIKVHGTRSRLTAVTPLRQVMSKSIQRAFAEHGLSAATDLRLSKTNQRKNIFDSTSSPDINPEEWPQLSALDLRLSPAVRRSQNASEEYLKQPLVSSSIPQQQYHSDLPNLQRNILLSAQKLTTESIVITRTEHLSTVSSSTSASSNVSINSMKPRSSTNTSLQSATSHGNSVFKSCSSYKIITATTEQIRTVENENIVGAMPPLTPITRIPGATIHKKLIKFDTPKMELRDLREVKNSPGDVFFTPNATPTSNEDEESVEVKAEKKLLVKQNLSGRFASLRRPSIKECAHSTAFSRIEQVASAFDDDYVDVTYNNYDDEVFLPEESENSRHKTDDNNKNNEPQQSGGLWSFMSSVMRLPLRKGSQCKDVSKKTNAQGVTSSNSNSIIKRCASIAGSLVHSDPLVDVNDLNSLKRKRSYTTDSQSTSACIAQLQNSEDTSPENEMKFNISSKRFRIQGRRPIDRMRLNN